MNTNLDVHTPAQHFLKQDTSVHLEEMVLHPAEH